MKDSEASSVHRGVRRVRRVALLWAMATLVLVGLLLASSGGKQASMPGPLSQNHAHLREDCGACHASEANSIQGLMHGLETTRLDLEQAEHCLRCHDLGQRPLAPHGRTKKEWADRLGSEAAALDLAKRPGPMSRSNGLACDTCHREHRGRMVPLEHLSDERCQVCHKSPFEAFGQGHPAFESFPYVRRTHLIFDHTQHILRQFRGEHMEDAPRSCTDCHRLDPTGRQMPLVGYELTCAACHDDEIHGSSQLEGMGLTILSLPAIDTLTLEDEGIAIGQWPADSMLTETPMTPFLELLLSADEAARADLALLKSVDLLDLQEADEQQLQAVGRTVWAIKSIFLEVEMGGHVAILDRLEEAIAGTDYPDVSQDLLAGLPEDLVDRALGSWIPNLAAEVEHYKAGEAVRSLPLEEEETEDFDGDKQHEAWVDGGGWYVEQMNFALRYRPTGHADPLLKAWLDLIAQSNEPTRARFAELFDPGAVGMCTKCHSVETNGTALAVNWNGVRQVTNRPSLTKYSHVEHFAADAENACITCHELNRENEGWESTYSDTDPTNFIPGFLPMSIETCSACHIDQGAPTACTTCHDYHAHMDAGTEPGASLNVFFNPPGK